MRLSGIPNRPNPPPAMSHPVAQQAVQRVRGVRANLGPRVRHQRLRDSSASGSSTAISHVRQNQRVSSGVAARPVSDRLCVTAAVRAPQSASNRSAEREVAPVRGQRVRHPLRPLLVGRRHDDPASLRPSESVGQDVRGDPGHDVAELVEPSRPCEVAPPRAGGSSGRRRVRARPRAGSSRGARSIEPSGRW